MNFAGPTKYSKNPIKRAITEVLKKQIEISRNPMIYNNLEFEKPVKAVDFCRSRGGRRRSIIWSKRLRKKSSVMGVM